MPGQPAGDFQEVEADAFAIEFMMPRWLISANAARQGWRVTDFRRPDIVYQLALRIGASYEATCWTLVRHRYLQQSQARQLLQTQPRELKVGLLEAYRPQDYRGDVGRSPIVTPVPGSTAAATTSSSCDSKNTVTAAICGTSTN